MVIHSTTSLTSRSLKEYLNSMVSYISQPTLIWPLGMIMLMIDNFRACVFNNYCQLFDIETLYSFTPCCWIYDCNLLMFNTVVYVSYALSIVHILSLDFVCLLLRCIYPVIVATFDKHLQYTYIWIFTNTAYVYFINLVLDFRRTAIDRLCFTNIKDEEIYFNNLILSCLNQKKHHQYAKLIQFLKSLKNQSSDFSMNMFTYTHNLCCQRNETLHYH